jgi:hypothetical protein
MGAEVAAPGTTRATVGRSLSAALGKSDSLNIVLLLAAFVLVMLIVPPVRSFPINDDWIYAHQVDKLVAWQYTPHPWTQASALSHVAWGALFALLFGSSYTILSIANLVASALCLVVFYRLMRVLDVTAPLALFGTALLFAQPMFFHLSTTFMTDITFLCVVLLACLLFVRAVQTARDAYLWVGSTAVALAFLNRQFGLALVLPVLAYLWATGRLTWLRSLAVVVVPVMAVVSYYAWEKGQPMVLISILTEKDLAARFEQPLAWLSMRAVSSVSALLVTTLFLVPLFKPVSRPLFAVVLAAILPVALLPIYGHYGMVAPFSGNVVDQHGFGSCCGMLLEPVWNNGVWAVLLVIGSLSSAFLLTRVVRKVSFQWVRSKRPLLDRPAALVYGSTAVLTAAAVLVPLTMFDRYFLPLVAAFILFACREASLRGTQGREVALRLALVVPMLMFSIAAQHDTMENRSLRWEASKQLTDEGVAHNKIGMSYEWGGEYLFDPEGERIRANATITEVTFIPAYLIDPEYYISEVPMPGYDVVQTEQYTSWLELGQTREVLVQKRR